MMFEHKIAILVKSALVTDNIIYANRQINAIYSLIAIISQAIHEVLL